MSSLDLRDEIEDILITLGKHYHLIRPMRARPGVFFYLAVDRSRANLALARMTLADAEKSVQFLAQESSGASTEPPARSCSWMTGLSWSRPCAGWSAGVWG